MVIHQTTSAIITFRQKDSVLLIQWLRKPDTGQLMDTYLRALAYVCSNRQTYYFCTDQTLIGSLDRDQEEWLSQEFYPKVYDCIQGEIFAAVVFNNEHFKALVTNYQVPALLPQQHFIQFNYFTKLQEALQWLSDIRKGQDEALLAPHTGLLSGSTVLASRENSQ
ncbi:hypothetical protein [Pontibacter chinhatensis]|uniref:SpoIIAA-like n=1 Tax=Pontibacter chinhatensis TaxID=1436961 RepID=A0A1I2MJ04_9BACT|nr:hypothetical protein [Pontibacter chinhatensis]SFF90719.1 hypothetical protein SAMN05421739_101330 [Pontibacter chinhatensis]